MNIRAVGFNCNLFLIVLLLLTGCETTKDANKPSAKSKKDKKEFTTLQLHLETGKTISGANAVPIYRQHPVFVSIDAAPFLDSANITGATVVNYLDGFAIQIQFDTHGAFVLDTVTTANRGKRIAINAIFPEQRWLAAPVISQRNAGGMLTFTPDATREEADRIVRGINNVAAEIRKKHSL